MNYCMILEVDDGFRVEDLTISDGKVAKDCI